MSISHPSRRHLMALGAAGLSSLALRPASAAPTLTGGDGSLDRVLKAGSIAFGTCNDQPFAFLNSKTGKIEGVDADMLVEIMAKLGIKDRKMVQSEFSGLIPGLLSKRIDVVADSMYITPKRQETISFSTGWYQYGETLLVKKGNPLNLTSLQDLSKGVRVGATVGTVFMDWLNAVPGAKASSYAQIADLLQDLRIGRVDAAMMEAPSAGYLLQQNPGMQSAFEVATAYRPKEAGIIGAGFRKEDVDLRQAFDWALAELKKEGTDLKLLAKWGMSEANRAPAA
jgi:polar amino acid transport system substrate-binding protein